MKTSPPTVARLRELLLYHPDTGVLVWRHSDTMRAARNTRWAGKSALTRKHRQGYLSGVIDGANVFAHRVAWAMHHGAWPEGEIDHVNHDKADNRVVNLREVAKRENARNLPKLRSNTSGVTGVARRRARWVACIRVDRKLRHLGSFASLEEAVAARRVAEQRHGFHPNHGVRAATQ